MINYLLRILIKQKLLIGALWLMLRGHSAECQVDTSQSVPMCYSVAPVSDFYHAFDLSLQGKVSHDWQQKAGGMSLLINRGWISAGIETQLFYPGYDFSAGPAIRVYHRNPLLSTPVFLVADLNFLKGISKYSSNEANVSLGLLLLDDKKPIGIDFFGNYNVNITAGWETKFFIGMKVHYYIQKK